MLTRFCSQLISQQKLRLYRIFGAQGGGSVHRLAVHDSLCVVAMGGGAVRVWDSRQVRHALQK